MLQEALSEIDKKVHVISKKKPKVFQSRFGRFPLKARSIKSGMKKKNSFFKLLKY